MKTLSKWFITGCSLGLLFSSAEGSSIGSSGYSVEALAYYSGSIGMYLVEQQGDSTFLSLTTTLKGTPPRTVQAVPRRLPTLNGPYIVFMLDLTSSDSEDTVSIPKFISLNVPTYREFPAATMDLRVLTSGDSVLTLVREWAKREPQSLSGIQLLLPDTTALVQHLPLAGAHWIVIPNTPQVRDYLVRFVKTTHGSARAWAMEELLKAYPDEDFTDLLLAMLSDSSGFNNGCYPARQYAYSKVQHLGLEEPSWYREDCGNGLWPKLVSNVWPDSPTR